jgi:hypothetical protein
MSVPVELAADLTLNVRNVNKAQNDIEKAVGGGALKGLTKAIKSTQKVLTTEYSKAYEDALRIGRKEDAALLKERWKANGENARAAADQVKALDKKIANTRVEVLKKLLKTERAGILSNLKLQQSGLRDMISERASAQEDQLKLFDEGMAKAARSFSDKAEDAAESFTDIINGGLTFDNMDPAGLIKSLGTGLKDQSGSLVSGGKKVADWGAGKGGAMGGAAKMLGKAAGSIGMAAGTLAAGAVAIAAVVGILAAAYGKVKDWNKAILEGASAYDMMGASVGELEPRLNNMRKAMTRV